MYPAIRTTASVIATLSVLIPTLAFAELKSQMSAHVITVAADGTEQYANAVTVEPGQLIEYRIRHRNTFNNAIGGVAIVGPVPEQAVVDPATLATSSPAILEVRGELDPDRPGEEWSTLPAQRIVVLDDGSRMIENARPEHFTAIRWTLSNPLQTHEQVTNTYRVRVK